MEVSADQEQNAHQKQLEAVRCSQSLCVVDLFVGMRSAGQVLFATGGLNSNGDILWAGCFDFAHDVASIGHNGYNSRSLWRHFDIWMSCRDWNTIANSRRVGDGLQPALYWPCCVANCVHRLVDAWDFAARDHVRNEMMGVKQ